MKFKVLDFLKEHQELMIAWISIVKMALGNLSNSDVILFISVIASIQASKVIGYLYPKRPDVFKEIEDLKENLSFIKKKNEEIDRDVTGLKFFAARK